MGEEKPVAATRHAYLTMFMAELIGTGMLMFLGCMGCVVGVDDPPAVHHMSSMSFGLVVLLIIQTFGHISGAHLNPAVTLAGVLLKVMTPMMGIVYVIAQFIGGTLGFALLKVVLPPRFGPGLCLTLPHGELTALQALAIETLITTTLILVVCAVWDVRNGDKPDSVPIRFGFIIVAISMVAGPFTGASMNTVRTFAPALLDGNWNGQWIYWVGPNVGAVIACGIYRFLFAVKAPEREDAEEVQHLQEIAQNNLHPEKV